MKREQAIQALQADILEACRELTLERLLVARNLVRGLVDQQDTERTRTALTSEIRLRTTIAPGLARAISSQKTVTDPLVARRRIKNG